MIDILMQGIGNAKKTGGWLGNDQSKSQRSGERSFLDVMKDAAKSEAPDKKAPDKPTKPVDQGNTEAADGETAEKPELETPDEEMTSVKETGQPVLTVVPILDTTAPILTNPVEKAIVGGAAQNQGVAADGTKAMSQDAAAGQTRDTLPGKQDTAMNAPKQQSAQEQQVQTTATKEAQPARVDARNSQQNVNRGGETQTAESDVEQPTRLMGDTAAKIQQTEPDKMFVKVGEEKLVSEPRQFTADVAEKILVKTAEGKQEFDIELSPKELGKINIKLIFEGGKAMILLHCSNPQTQQMLMANAEQMRHILESGTGLHTEVAANKEAQGSMQDQNLDGRGENQAREEQNDRKQSSTQTMSQQELSAFMQRLRFNISQEAV